MALKPRTPHYFVATNGKEVNVALNIFSFFKLLAVYIRP